VNEGAVRSLAKHFVSLTWQDTTPGERAERNAGAGQHFAVSGFLASVNGHWFLVTAGHILREIEGALVRGQSLEGWRLDDSWSLEAKRLQSADAKRLESVPFDFPDAPKIYIDEKGADYALIYIRPLVRDALRANGCEPIDETSWTAEWPSDFDFYVLLGLPDDLAEDRSGGLIEKYLVALPVTPVADPPETLRSPWPRFYGKVPLPLEVGTGKWLTSIKGMSGGPLFAIKNQADGRQAYWITGVQSGWDADEKVIAAAPSKVFFELAVRRLDTAQLPAEVP